MVEEVCQSQVALSSLNLSPGAKSTYFAVCYHRAVKSTRDFEQVQSNVDSISTRMIQDLYWNASKTKAMVTRKKHPPTAVLKVDGTGIDVVNSVKYLGFELSSDMTWIRHIHSGCSRAR